MGSGSLAAMSIFEAGWQPDLSVFFSFLFFFFPFLFPFSFLFFSFLSFPFLSFPFLFQDSYQQKQREQAINLVHHAIKAGIFNDLGSGSNVDVCVITKVCIFLLLLFSLSQLSWLSCYLL